MAGHNSRYKTLLNSSDFPSVVRRLHFTGSKLTIICSLMTTLKTCIRTITYLSDIGCLEIQGASLPPYCHTSCARCKSGIGNSLLTAELTGRNHNFGLARMMIRSSEKHV